VLGAPLTVVGVATAEAAEAPVMEQLLTAVSYADGERVVRAVAGFRVRRGGAATWGNRRRDDLTGEGAGCDPSARCARTAEMMMFGHTWTGVASTVRRQRGSDSGEALSAGTFMARCGLGPGCVAATWKQRAGGLGAERERLTGGTLQQ
jgi:hypothetical protein